MQSLNPQDNPKRNYTAQDLDAWGITELIGYIQTLQYENKKQADLLTRADDYLNQLTEWICEADPQQYYQSDLIAETDTWAKQYHNEK